jgi:hypothetical protein
MNGKTFLHFRLSTQAVAIGERVKGGTFRPCIGTIPTSTLKGAFKERFGLENVAAIGFFDKTSYQKALFTYSPFDTMLNAPKVPITIEYLKPKDGFSSVAADVYALKDESISSLTTIPVQISIGALKSKGFGRCSINYLGEVSSKLKVGYLKGRLLEKEEAAVFGIMNIIKASYGYLFYPKNKITGVYKRALFQGSIIEGPEILIDGEYRYDIPT